MHGQRAGAGRKRDAAATRAAILEAAEVAFTRHGYDGVGAREIAADAGVTAMLVNRYFGSKEGLFEEVVDRAFAPRTVIPDDRETLARSLAERLVARTTPGADPLDPFLLMLRSAGNTRAAEIIALAVSRHAGHALSEQLSGPEPEVRAMLANALIAGFWLLRTVLAIPGLTEGDPTQLTRRLGAAFGVLLVALSRAVRAITTVAPSSRRRGTASGRAPCWSGC